MRISRRRIGLCFLAIFLAIILGMVGLSMSRKVLLVEFTNGTKSTLKGVCLSRDGNLDEAVDLPPKGSIWFKVYPTKAKDLELIYLDQDRQKQRVDLSSRLSPSSSLDNDTHVFINDGGLTGILGNFQPLGRWENLKYQSFLWFRRVF